MFLSLRPNFRVFVTKFSFHFLTVRPRFCGCYLILIFCWFFGDIFPTKSNFGVYGVFTKFSLHFLTVRPYFYFTKFFSSYYFSSSFFINFFFFRCWFFGANFNFPWVFITLAFHVLTINHRILLTQKVASQILLPQKVAMPDFGSPKSAMPFFTFIHDGGYAFLQPRSFCFYWFDSIL